MSHVIFHLSTVTPVPVIGQYGSTDQGGWEGGRQRDWPKEEYII